MKITYKELDELSESERRLVFEGLEFLVSAGADIGNTSYWMFSLVGSKGFLAFYTTHAGIYISKAYVRPEHRRQGILAALLGDLPNHYEGNIAINTAPDNAAMQAALTKLGYKARHIEYTRGG